MTMDAYREMVAREIATVERQFEECGVIAYEAGEAQLVLVFESGGILKIDSYFYPEGSWTAVNGVNFDTLEPPWRPGD